MASVDQLNYVLVFYVQHFNCASNVCKIIFRLRQIWQTCFCFVSCIAANKCIFLFKIILFLFFCCIFNVIKNNLEISSLHKFVYCSICCLILQILQLPILVNLLDFFMQILKPLNLTFCFICTDVFKGNICMICNSSADLMWLENPVKPQIIELLQKLVEIFLNCPQFENVFSKCQCSLFGRLFYLCQIFGEISFC